MALNWVEPWDQYGGNAALIGSFGYSFANVGLTAAGRTGTYAGVWNSGAANFCQRTQDVAQPILGSGAAIKITATVVGQNADSSGIRFHSNGNVTEFTVVFMDGLKVGVFDRTNTLLGQSAGNKLILNSYVWVEVKGTVNTGGVNTGKVEVRVQGITVLTINGINLPNNLIQTYIGGGFSTWGFLVDDWVIWDGTGAKNNDFLGDRALFASFPNANVAAHQDFVPSAGNAFNCVNQLPPVDTTFIEGAAGNISEFTKGAIGIASTDIAAVVAIGRLFKSDAGTASGRLGINSNGNILNGPSTPPGTTGAWFRNIVELDPNGNIPWTKAAADAANIRITRDV